jgi:hypothetical protein
MTRHSTNNNQTAIELEEESCNVCSANEYEASMTEDNKGNSICTDCYDKVNYELGSSIPDIDGEIW